MGELEENKDQGAKKTASKQSSTPKESGSTPQDQKQEVSLQEREEEYKNRIEQLEGENHSLMLQKDALEEAIDDANEVIKVKDETIASLQDEVKHYGILDESKATIIEGLEQKLESASSLSKSPGLTKDVVMAVKNGIEREFPKLAWDSLKDKQGWKIKVETPKEAQ
ncbi:hypothetical protein FAZ19_16245 [Sphingobacterium alkalisoli]|uniref:DUF3450 domain-containing protein n=1 Tax=Sphingobacterium alkalisoli TaxID=1874115 RepID=A0A4U0GXF0_9SPHI|nr:hypothetical protein [Sphingobacterium alkalisoli]TJY63817.1 hypothetical protein FAZ19_16245 [Sphingobacterium alkalisoli]GGH24695.1 hypothetical protein GCM10011418_32780 [Sphingobacterium alkalisoli]